MNKKYLTFGLLGFFALALVGAAVLIFSGQITDKYPVEQAVTLDGVSCTDNVCTETYGTVYSPDITYSGLYVLTNNDPLKERDVELERTNCSPDCDGITTSYLQEVGYTYSANIAGVLVDVTDEGEWLQWTYTYSATPTHTPKMTVEINYPNGFAVTTFDDGTHDGWYYYDTVISETKFAEYVGGNYSDFVETTASGNVLTVKIKKSALGTEFEWHGYANLDGSQVWINSGETGTGYSVPIFEVDTFSVLTSPFTMGISSDLSFVIKNEFNTTPGTYTVTTGAQAL